MSDHKMKIVRSAKNIFDAAKDNTISNIVNCTVNGQIQVDMATLQKITNLIGASLDESFQKSVKSFEKEVDSLGVVDASFYFKKNSP